MRMETGKRIVQSWNAKSPLEQEAACRRSSNFSMKDSSKKCSWKIQKGQLQELQIIRKLKTWTNTQDQHGPTWTTAFQTQIIFKGAMFTIQIKYIQICSFSFESLFTSHGLHAQGHASRLVPHPLGFTRHTLLLDKFVSISRLWDSGEADPVHVAPKTPRAWRLKAKTMIVYQIWWYDDMMIWWYDAKLKMQSNQSTKTVWFAFHMLDMMVQSRRKYGCGLLFGYSDIYCPILCVPLSQAVRNRIQLSECAAKMTWLVRSSSSQ